jgi:hypothetical protein
MFKSKFILGIAIATCAFGAQARDLYVGCAESANDVSNAIGTGTNSPTKTYRQPAAAARDTQAGDTVWFVGTCTFEPFKVEISGAENAFITYRAAPSSQPTIGLIQRVIENKVPKNVARDTAVRINASYIRISGLTIRGLNQTLNRTTDLDAAKATFALVNPSLPYNAQTNPRVDVPIDPRFISAGIRTWDSIRSATDPYSHHIRIDSNTISDFACAGIGVSGDYFTIENNAIYNNAWYSGYGCSGLTLFATRNHDLNPGYHNIIARNRAWDNYTLVNTFQAGKLTDGHGLLMDLDSTEGGYKGRTLFAQNITANNGGGGVVVFKNSHVDVVNNISYMNNWNIGGTGIAASYSKDIRVMNNINYYDGADIRQTATRGSFNDETVIYDHNLYYNGSTAASILFSEFTGLKGNGSLETGKPLVCGANDIIGQDPLFFRPLKDLGDPARNFNLRAGSPAIDKGISILGVTLDKDYRYATREQGSAIDIGAYEQTAPINIIAVPTLSAPAFFKLGLNENVDITLPASNVATCSWERRSKDNLPLANTLVALTISKVANACKITGLVPIIESITNPGTASSSSVRPSSYTYTITATNSAGRPSKARVVFSFVALRINAPDTYTVRRGNPVNLQITATNKPTKFEATNLPEGLQINQTTGAITGTPTPTGTNVKTTVSITVRNIIGNEKKDIVFTVNPS